MDRLFFQDIFYPTDEDSLSALVKAKEKKEEHTPSLFLLPHAHLDAIAHMYRDAFSLIHHPKRIVILAPLHAEVLDSDKGHSLFTYESGIAITPLGEVNIEEAPSVRITPDYAEEEYSIELFYPYVAANCPSTTIMPILAKLDGKEDVIALAHLISKLKKAENNTVFIVSGNFTSEGRCDEILRQARTLEQLLENNAPLLEATSKKLITGCACKILEATRTTTSGHFHLKSAHCGSYTGPTISESAEGTIWQVYGVKE